MIQEYLPYIFIILGCATLITALLKPSLLPYLIMVSFPCGNFLIDWYVQWSAGKVVLLVVFVMLPFIALNNRKLRTYLRMPSFLLAFIIVQLISTVIATVLFQDTAVDFGMDFSRSATVRPIVQLLSQWIRIAALVAVIGWVRDRHSLVRMYKTGLFVSTWASIYGVYQFIGYYAGWPIMGIARAQEELSGQMPVFQVAGFEMFRVGSFVGEPKFLAQWLVPSALFIIAVKVFPKMLGRSWLTSYPVLALHILVFLLTFATSAYFGVLVGAVPLLWMWWTGRSRAVSGLHALMVAAVVGAILVGMTFYFGENVAMELLRGRTVDRINSESVSVVVDLATIDYIKEHPLSLVTGIGSGNATFQLSGYSPEVDWLLAAGPISISSTYLRYLLEGGIPVLFVLVFFLGKWVLRSRELALSTESPFDMRLLLTGAGICWMIFSMGIFYNSETGGPLWPYWGLLIAHFRMVDNSRGALQTKGSFSTETVGRTGFVLRPEAAGLVAPGLKHFHR